MADSSLVTAMTYSVVRQSRNIPVRKATTALLIIDMQDYCAKPGRGVHSDIDPNKPQGSRCQYFFSRLETTTIPAIQKLLNTFREKKGEVIFTWIESLTKDCRDQSLDYKISGFGVPKGHPDAKIIDELQPQEDEILIPKTSCSVFMSTNIEYVLRNLGVSQIVVTGIMTNQCVESAVRDAADLGFYVTVVEDGCASHTQQDHDHGIKNMAGFSRISSSQEVIQEVKLWD